MPPPLFAYNVITLGVLRAKLFHIQGLNKNKAKKT